MEKTLYRMTKNDGYLKRILAWKIEFLNGGMRLSFNKYKTRFQKRISQTVQWVCLRLY